MFIVKVPAINGEKSKGCERAGEAVIKELRNVHSNEQGAVIDVDMLDLEEIHINNSDLEITNKLIYENGSEIFSLKPRTIFLGGDGSISYSLAKAFLDGCNSEREQACLIIFDSHADCMNSEEYATSRNWLRMLIENGFPRENILIVGIRNMLKEEIKFLKENKIKTISVSSLTENLSDMCETIMEFSNRKNLYLSIDIDVIDSSFAPSTSYPEAGGLTSREFLYLIQRIKKIKTLKAVDLVEINEKKDKDKTTVKLGAKIVAELL